MYNSMVLFLPLTLLQSVRLNVRVRFSQHEAVLLLLMIYTRYVHASTNEILNCVHHLEQIFHISRVIYPHS